MIELGIVIVLAIAGIGFTQSDKKEEPKIISKIEQCAIACEKNAMLQYKACKCKKELKW